MAAAQPTIRQMQFGGPWLGQNDGRAIDLPPGAAYAQTNCWFSDATVLRRRNAVAKASTPLTATPINVLPLYGEHDTYTSGGTLYVQRLLCFDATGDAEIVYTNSSGAVAVKGCRDRDKTVYSYPGQAEGLAWVNTTAGVLLRDTAYLCLSSSDNPTFRDTTDGMQLMTWDLKPISDPASVVQNNTGGHLVSGQTYYFTYRFELRDGDGIMRMCSKWADPQSLAMSGGNTQAVVTLPYWWDMTGAGSARYGIVTTATPASWSDSYNWNIPVNYQYVTGTSAWKLYLVTARTLQGVSSEGPYYYAEEKDLHTYGTGSIQQITITLGADYADSDLSVEYDVWVDPFGYHHPGTTRDCTDLVSINGVFAWMKNFASGGQLWFGTYAYPYLASTDNYLVVDRYSSLVPMPDGSLLVLGPAHCYLVRGIPDITSVEEVPTAGLMAILSGEWWGNQNGVFACTSYGDIVKCDLPQFLSDFPMPWLSGIGASGNTISCAVHNYRITLVSRSHSGGSRLCYAVRDTDNAAWDTGEYYAIKRNDARWIIGFDAAKNIWVNDGEGVADDNNGTDVSIDAAWRSAWQGGEFPGRKAIRLLEVHQDANVACRVFVDVTDRPDMATPAERQVMADQPTMTFDVNLSGRYFRVRIESVDGQAMAVRKVVVTYAVETAK